MSDKSYDFAELFCGPGGLSLGAMLSVVKDSKGVSYTFNPVWANDIDAAEECPGECIYVEPIYALKA